MAGDCETHGKEVRTARVHIPAVVNSADASMLAISSGSTAVSLDFAFRRDFATDL
jgi:hypothetical protein